MKTSVSPKPPKMVKCPGCKATGIQEIQSTTISPGKPVEKSVTQIICIICRGAAVVHPRVVKALEREAELWCSCEKPNLEDSIFCDDGTCSDCEKHHYHCGTCKKICQVG
jgi:hypothetical protein